mmetsp:Transcript_2578/g.4410  ORF Transcript_2578/g.4410 Transcript_2578/m.4410 type:complete len:235 (+) Transcript_2578:861-1565(+)
MTAFLRECRSLFTPLAFLSLSTSPGRTRCSTGCLFIGRAYAWAKNSLFRSKISGRRTTLTLSYRCPTRRAPPRSNALRPSVFLIAKASSKIGTSEGLSSCPHNGCDANRFGRSYRLSPRNLPGVTFSSSMTRLYAAQPPRRSFRWLEKREHFVSISPRPHRRYVFRMCMGSTCRQRRSSLRLAAQPTRRWPLRLEPIGLFIRNSRISKLRSPMRPKYRVYRRSLSIARALTATT